MKISSWIRRKLIKFLNLPEIYISADIYYESSVILIMRINKKTGLIEVIGDYYNRNRSFKSILCEVETLARRYNVKKANVVIDAPFDYKSIR